MVEEKIGAESSEELIEKAEEEYEVKTEVKTKAGSDDNLMAAIAHAGIIITVIVALIIWLIQKDKSKYVEFQAKQALVYQIVVAVLGFVLSIVIFILGIVTLGIGFILYFLLPLLGLAAVIYGLYGAYECYNGGDFRYIWIGDMLSK